MAFQGIGLLTLVMWIGALLLQGFALVHCLLQRAEAFPLADKWNKWGWTAITVVAFLITFVYRNVISLLPLIGFIASCVYLVDVRPAVREISGGRGSSGGRDTGRW